MMLQHGAKVKREGYPTAPQSQGGDVNRSLEACATETSKHQSPLLMIEMAAWDRLSCLSRRAWVCALSFYV
jgi:hypothetical protein